MTHHANSTGLQSARWPGRDDLQQHQISQLVTMDATTGAHTVVFESDDLFESPNWTPDGAWLVINGKGGLWKLPADGSAPPQLIDIGGIRKVNNDHVLSPDGQRVYFSADGHLYQVPLEGGAVRRISNVHPDEEQYSYWLHGVSPDESTLAYVSVEPDGDDPRAKRNLATIPVAGGPDTRLTQGVNAYDGPEYSPDGQWIYYNSEEAATAPGHAQLFRMRTDGSDRAQLTFDDRVNWFPHLSPVGDQLVYISYAPGVTSHPADLDVELRILATDGGHPRTVAQFFGGQGSLNCNSWAPGGDKFAFFAYPSTL